VCDICGDKGRTSKMVTSLPFFKEVALISFSCEVCGNKSSEVNFGSKLTDFGVKMECKISDIVDLNKLIIKSEFASIIIPELNLEIPARTQKGSMSSVEATLMKMINGLEEEQKNRKETDIESYNKIGEFIKQAQEYATGVKLPFTIVLDDPSGNSCIYNPCNPEANHIIEHYTRTREQLIEMGYTSDGEEFNNNIKEEMKQEENVSEAQTEEDKNVDTNNESKEIDFTKPLSESKQSTELAVIDIPCYACGEMGKNRICICQVPHFKKLVTMCFECDKCGYKSTEVKTSGAISEKGKRFILSVKNIEDLTRELYKVFSEIEIGGYMYDSYTRVRIRNGDSINGQFLYNTRRIAR